LHGETTHGANVSENKTETFQFNHGFKKVVYSGTEKFYESNQCHLPDAIAAVLMKSENKLFENLFQARIKLTGGMLLHDLNQKPIYFTDGFSQSDTKHCKKTEICRASLVSLLSKMVSCSCHFVRCIKSVGNTPSHTATVDGKITQRDKIKLIELAKNIAIGI
jgi:myosin heavy subunit